MNEFKNPRCMRHIVFLCMMFFMFVSCDIPGKITLQNTQNFPVLFNIYRTDSDNLITKKEFMLTEKTGKKATISILYGFGYFWTDENIERRYFYHIENRNYITNGYDCIKRHKRNISIL